MVIRIIINLITINLSLSHGRDESKIYIHNNNNDNNNNPRILVSDDSAIAGEPFPFKNTKFTFNPLGRGDLKWISSLLRRFLITTDSDLVQVNLPQSFSTFFSTLLCPRLDGVRHSLALPDSSLSGHTIASP